MSKAHKASDGGMQLLNKLCREYDVALWRNKVLQKLEHPDMLEDDPTAVTNPAHLHRGRNLERKRSPLRDIPYLSGNHIEREKQLVRRKTPACVRGDRHYMRKRAKAREYERIKHRTTPRGVKHLYTFWRNYRSPTDVSFEEWFTLRYNSGFEVGEWERIAISRYDMAKPFTLDNLCLVRMKGTVALEVLADAETLIGERKDVKMYVAPPGKMDKRRKHRGTIDE